MSLKHIFQKLTSFISTNLNKYPASRLNSPNYQSVYKENNKNQISRIAKPLQFTDEDEHEESQTIHFKNVMCQLQKLCSTMEVKANNINRSSQDNLTIDEQLNAINTKNEEVDNYLIDLLNNETHSQCIIYTRSEHYI